MPEAAELRALPEEQSLLCERQRDVLDRAGDEIALEADLGHPQSVDHVLRGEVEANGLTDRDDERLAPDGPAADDDPVCAIAKFPFPFCGGDVDGDGRMANSAERDRAAAADDLDR